MDAKTIAMQKSLLGSVIQTAGFATIGFLFFVWYLGHQKNTQPYQISAEESSYARAEAGMVSPNRTVDREAVESSYAKSGDYAGRGISLPERVTRETEPYVSRPATTERESSVYRNRESRSTAREANTVRSWKGVHRDESYAWLCFERFGREVVSLSAEHGLYPEVFMARIIAYAYEFTEDPRANPADNNFTALPHPKSGDRALFRTPEESLKAYAVVHAGEVARLSREGAIAKNDRAWTMRKIIDSYAFVSNLAAETADRDGYRGRIGTANKKSEEANYQREVVGEAMKMVSSVDDIVKKRRAESAGYSNWEDYLDDLTEEERLAEEEKADAKTSAVSKKKAFNLSRRVDAKKQKED